jgi:predicted transcriptional regulator
VNIDTVTRAELHGLVDEIPDDRLESVAALLIEIVEDDESLTADDLAALAESEEDVAAGRVRPAADVLNELDL